VSELSRDDVVKLVADPTYKTGVLLDTQA